MTECGCRSPRLSDRRFREDTGLSWIPPLGAPQPPRTTHCNRANIFLRSCPGSLVKGTTIHLVMALEAEVVVGSLHALPGPGFIQRCSSVMKRGGHRARLPEGSPRLSPASHERALGPSHLAPHLENLLWFLWT